MAYGVILYLSFYHYSLVRTDDYHTFGATVHNVLLSAGFAAITFFPACIVALYFLFAATTSTFAKIGVRVGVVALAALGCFFLQQASHELDMYYPLYLIEVAIIIGYIEINRHLKTVKSKTILACATGGLLFTVLAIIFCLASNEEFWGYVFCFIMIMLIRTCPQLVASAFLVGRKIPQSARVGHAIVGCCLFLCGCVISEAWITADEAQYTRQLNAWKEQHIFLTPEERTTAEAELDKVQRQWLSSKQRPTPEQATRMSELGTLLANDRFKRKRVWPNQGISMWWIDGKIHNSVY